MTEVVINTQHGGFGLSAKGTEAYLARKGKQTYWFANAKKKNGRTDFGRIVPTDNPDGEFVAFSFTVPHPDLSKERWSEDEYISCRDIPRDDPDLIAVVREMGDAASSKLATLEIVEIPDDVDWQIEEYDGLEWVAEKHRVWS